MSPHISGALTSSQTQHTLTSLAAIAGLEAARDGQAGDGDGQSQGSASSQKLLSCCLFLHHDF